VTAERGESSGCSHSNPMHGIVAEAQRAGQVFLSA
jgi:hypothetical protein